MFPLHSKMRIGRPLSFHLILALLSTLLTTIFAVILSIQLQQIATDHLTEYYHQLDQSQFEQISSALSHKLGNLEISGSIINNDADLLSILEEYEPLSFSTASHLRNCLNSLLFRSKSRAPELVTLFLLSDKYSYQSSGSLYAPDSQRVFLNYFPECRESPVLHIPVSDSSASNKFLRLMDESLFLSYPITRSDGQTFHVCLLAEPDLYENLLQKYDRVALVDDGGHILFNSTSINEDSLCNPALLSQQAFLTEIRSGLTLIYQGNPQPYLVENNHIRLLLIMSVVVTALISFLVSYFAVQPFSRPLREFAQRLSMQGRLAQAGTIEGHLKNPFRRLFLYFFTVAMSFTVLISLIFSVNFNARIREDYTSSLNESLEQLMITVDSFFDDIQNTSFYLSYHSDLQDTLLHNQKNGGIENDTMIKEFLEGAQNWFSDPLTLCIYDNAGRILGTTNSVLYADSSSFFERSSAEPRWYRMEQKQNEYLVYQSSIRSVDTFQKFGCLSVKINSMFLERHYSSFYPTSCTTYLHQPDGTVLLSSRKTESYEKLPDTDGRIVFSKGIPNTNLYMTFMIDTSGLLTYRKELFRSYIYLLIIITLAAIAISYSISLLFLRSLQELDETLSISPSEYNIISRRNSPILEFDQLYKNFYQMTQRIQDLLEQTAYAEWRQYQQELTNQHTDLLLLQSQISPHFLYNTFEAICHMIHIGDQEHSIMMLNRLSTMFRFATKNNQQLVSLEEELVYLENYAQIMKVRYPDSLIFSFNVAPEAKSVKIVKFILQPIVENSILHGFAPRGGQGVVNLNAVIMNDLLLITIRDNGVGMNADSLRQLQDSLNKDEYTTSIGLPNISRRLRLTFGAEYGLSISSTPGEGMVVSIVIPAEEFTDNTANEILKRQ